ncbi:PDC sensor domain-containing protein [Paenibacillus sp. DMB20]|uniref:PDC sensor domain-containing protein n=1 Tax=Paenibacillus sp. DMB20 TaxID=1642570 RepID=UPI000A94A3B9|nr:PDC sensor domain-containing protein [Paenibacillus sp. DMB20]
MDRLLRSMKDSLHYSVEVLRNYPQMTTDETNQKLELLRKTSQFFNSIALIDETGRFHSTSPSSLRGLEGTIVTSEVAKEMLKKKSGVFIHAFYYN